MKILIYRIGQLGDTIVALPAIRAVRQHWPRAKVALLCNGACGPGRTLAEEVFAGTDLVDEIVVYGPRENRWLMRGLTGEILSLWPCLRRHRFDAFVYLAPSQRKPWRRIRDELFFKTLGISAYYGFSGFSRAGRDRELPEVDLLLRRLQIDGIPVPEPGTGNTTLPSNADEIAFSERWFSDAGIEAGKPLLAVGPGSKMPSKRWPIERYAQTVKLLIDHQSIFPIVFGSNEDHNAARRLIEHWGTGANAAGILGVQAASLAIGKCALYLGNDTGTMHLAAAAKVPVVAVYSHREIGRNWYPYGVPSRVLQRDVACKGCELTICSKMGHPCITEITVDSVYNACVELISLTSDSK